MVKIKNLEASIEDKKILKGIYHGFTNKMGEIN